MSNVIPFPVRPRIEQAPKDYYDLALRQLMLVLAGLRDTPECRFLQEQMRRQWFGRAAAGGAPYR